MDRIVTACLAFAIVVFALPPSHAQTWPERSIHFVVPYPPGGNADVVGRIIADALQQKLGKPVVVDNKTGAGGIVGASFVTHSAPDGYTFLFSADGPILFAPELVPQPPYQWDKAFAPVTTISVTPLVVVVNPSFPVRTFDDFLAQAHKLGDKLIFAAGGMGTTNHLFGELIRSQLGLKWTTVQYRGTAPAMQDVISGQAQFTIDQVSSASHFIKAGSVRALATSSAQRWPALSDVPDMSELGYPVLVANTFTALMAPAGTPGEIVGKMSETVAAVVKDPIVRKRIGNLGSEIQVMSPEAFTDYLKKEASVWTPIVRKIRSK